ncbi:bifunctional diguanylate cyclase/phosphodiesterase [Mycobacterium hodleri]|uniref:putative bifunctional diguanylate cyclase/phosphodiesterase n=1 Tax=Mycolicibacterium hodleri TaxID=49897 RepID=UPI0021F2F7D8|nr:bifunctional diguanylate cyclase/phosphodiesterase [Mycolicibacterium hodleri]MCV7133510.1 bifunctional diguanylate cyclase/phosphodiesterase [Mycolicibacterium hodleri]
MTLPDPRRAAAIGVVLWGVYLAWSVVQGLTGQAISPAAGRTVSGVAFAAFGLFALVCASMAAVSNGGRARAAWVFVGIGAAAWIAAIAGSDLRSPLGAIGVPFASVADAGFIVFPIATCVALLLLHVGPSGSSTMRLLMDGLVVAGSLFLIAWIVVLRELFDAGRTDPVVLAVRVAYPILDLVAITVGVLVTMRAKGAIRMSVASLTVGIVLMSISNDVLYHLVAGSGRGGVHLLDLGWATSLLAVGLGALAGCGQRRAGHIPVHDTLWLPYVPLSVAGVVVVADLAKPASAVVLMVSVALVVVVMLRQFLVMGSNQRLLAVVAEQALQDPLTGLANRYLFNDRLHHAVELHRRELFGVLAVLTLDLDDFKLVNDGLGHAAGDALLVDVAARIRSAVRSGDTIARLGGDEFAILIEKGPETPDSVAQRVVDAFEQPFLVDGHLLPIRPSVGLSVAQARDRDLRAEVLLKQSDLAMYAAKRTSGSGVVTFASDTGPLRGLQGEDDAPRLGLLGDLRAAIEHGDLSMVYQPKVDLRVGAQDLVGVEALVRWPHPEHGLLTPGEFLPLVRRHDLMAPMTELVFDLVFADSAQWRGAGRTVPVAVNLFAPSFDDADLPDRLIAALGGHGLAATELTLEITEELVIQNVPGARQVLERLRECGIRVSVDDFGSGFGGLHYLRELPVDEVKLDREFVMPILEDRRTASIVRAVIELAHDLGVTCVAEGVESAAVAARLREYGCDLAQGYHFSPPIAATELLETLTNLDPQATRS